MQLRTAFQYHPKNGVSLRTAAEYALLVAFLRREQCDGSRHSLPRILAVMRLLTCIFLACVVIVGHAVRSVDYGHGDSASSSEDGVHCAPGSTLEAVSEWRTFSDGSHHQQLYARNLKCGWHIKAKSGQKILFTFRRFATQVQTVIVVKVLNFLHIRIQFVHMAAISS